MAELISLNPSLFAELTSAGTVYAISSMHQNDARQLLIQILKEGGRTPLTEEQLLSWSGMDSLDKALQLLYRLQRLKFVYGTDTPHEMPVGNFETMLTELLIKLSKIEKALLADDNGFYVACIGFHHEVAEELAALASNMLSINSRHERLIKNNLKITSNAWSISDFSGHSELGFYPFYIGKQTLILIIGGDPCFEGIDFVTMIQVLIQHYL